jgi:hypothetical protein
MEWNSKLRKKKKKDFLFEREKKFVELVVTCFYLFILLYFIFIVGSIRESR